MFRFTSRKVVATVGAVALAALVAAPASAAETAPETVSILAATADGGPVVLVAQGVELPLAAYVRGTIAVTADGRIVLPDGTVIGEYLDPIPAQITSVTWPIYAPWDSRTIIGEAVDYPGGVSVATHPAVGTLGAPHIEEAA